MDFGENVTDSPNDFTETLDDLNRRYADALVPMAFWMGLLAVMGIFGNLLVIVVFALGSEYKNSNFKVFVLSLGLVDLLTCCSLMPAEMIKTRHYFSFPDPMPCKIKCFFNLFGQNASAFVLLVICVDRYRKVCKPLSVQIWPELATKLMLAVMSVSVLLSLPAPILCGISSARKTNIRGTNTTVFFCAAEEKYQHSPFRYIYKIGLTVSLLCVSVSFIVMYSFILRTIVKHWRNLSNGESVRFDDENPEKLKSIGTPKCSYSQHTKCITGTPVVNGPIFIHSKGVLGTKPNGGYYNGKCQNQLTSSTASLKTTYVHKKGVLVRSGSDSSMRAYTVRKSSSHTNSKLPYKTLIWIILTLVFIITYFINALLSFITTDLYQLSPEKLLLFTFFFRIYFINNIINPIIYLCLDKRFKMSCSNIINLLRRRWRLMRR